MKDIDRICLSYANDLGMDAMGFNYLKDAIVGHTFYTRKLSISIGFIFNGECKSDCKGRECNLTSSTTDKPYKIIVYCVGYDSYLDSEILTENKSIHALRGELAYALKDMRYTPADAVLRDYKIDTLLGKE